MFAQPEYLFLLLLTPVFLLLFFVQQKRGQNLLKSYIKGHLIPALSGPTLSKQKLLKHILLLLVFVFLVLGAAGPQSYQKEKATREIKGAEVMILADVSKSMLVQDMGGLSRLEVMKKELNKLLEKLANQRVGLISFAGAPNLVSPLTLDHSSLKLFLKGLSAQDPILQGSDFGSALRAGFSALKRGSALPPGSLARVILIASDGEDNENQALKEAKTLATQNIRIFTLGLGTKKGGMIPIYNQQGQKMAYKKDSEGSPVVSRFNPQTLKQLANTGKGAFYLADMRGEAIQNLYADIKGIGEGSLSFQSQNQYKQWYHYFVWLALLCGALSFLIGDSTKTRPFKTWHSNVS